MTNESISPESTSDSRSRLHLFGSKRIGRTLMNAGWPASLTGLALIFLAGLIRLIDINRGLWLDELHTSWVVSGQFSEVISRAAAGNQSPLYFILLWPIVSLFQQSELSLRIVSLMSGVLVTFSVWQVVAALSRSKWAGILAAALVSIDPFFIEYSQEARPYALLQLIGLWQIYFFYNLMAHDFPFDSSSSDTCPEHLDRNPESQKAELCIGDQEAISLRRDRIGLVACALVGFYLHMTAILLTVAMLLIYASRFVWGGYTMTRIRAWRIIDFGVVLLGCLPMWPIIKTVSGRRANWELFVNDSSQTASIHFQLWVYLIPALVICVIQFVQRSKRSISDLSVLGLCYLIPILLAWIALKTGLAALYHHRYFMIGWTGIILMLAIAWGRLMRTRSRPIQLLGWISVIVVVGLSLGKNELLKSAIREQKVQMPFESPWNRAVTHLNDQLQNQPDERYSIVYLFPNLIEDRFLVPDRDNQIDQSIEEYCLFPVRGIYPLEANRAFAKSTLFRPRFSQLDALQMRDAKRVTLMIRGNQAVQSDILAEFAKFGFQSDLYFVITKKKAFEVRGAPGHSISLYYFDVRPSVSGSQN